MHTKPYVALNFASSMWEIRRKYFGKFYNFELALSFSPKKISVVAANTWGIYFGETLIF